MGVFSSCVTALMKLSCCSLRPDFAHQKTRVEDQARDEQREKNDAEEQQHRLAPVQDDPADLQRDGYRDQADCPGR